MYKQSDAALTAWRATERTLDGKVTITDSSGNETDYATSDITSIAYDSGAWTGDTFSIGSTYENNMTVTFAHLVEGLKQGYKVTAKIGIKLPDGTYEYCPLGVFIISDEITMDRNNDATTIKAYDQFCVMQGTYTSKLTYPAKVTDVIAEIANMSGVTLNTNDIAELPTQTDLASAISGQTYCTAIGWIAQFYGGFALFDRDGKLTIRTVTDASYILDASQYEQSGLTKNEATYQIGGMSVSVTTSTTDSTGESSETTSTLTTGETTGSQIELTNNAMTQTRLDSIWSTIKDITFYPYSLTWFGNPAIEAGDWLTLKDTKGNSFNVPNNSYTMTFDGGLTATSKADQTSTASSSYSYSGTLSQTVKQLAGRIGATGNYIYGTDTTQEPNTAKIGDQWYKQNGNKVELWQYVRQSDGSGKWTLIVSDLTSVEISANVDKAMAEADTAKQNANAAVEIGNQALTKAQAGIDIANAAADNANTAMSNSSTAINNAKSAMTDAANAINTANNSSDIANAVQQQVTTLKDGSTMTIADLANGLALKLVKSDLNGYATQSWASSQITATANDLQSQVASVKSTADKATTDITTLNQRASGWDSTISSLSTNKADQSWTTNQIKASADSLNVNISKVQTQVSSLNFGSYNILNGTGMDDSTTKLHQGVGGISYAVTINSDSSSPTGKSFTLARTDGGTTQGGAYWEVPAPLTVGKQYSWSIWAKGTGVINTVGPEQGGQSSITLTSAYTKYTKTFTATSSQYSQFTFYGNDGNVNATFLPIVLIEGNISPSWCRSVSDTATVTEVTNLSIALDGIKQTVSKKVDNDMFNSYKTQTATLIDSKVASNDFNSYKTQTDNALSQRVTSALLNSYQTQTDKAIQQRVTSATYNAEVTTLSNMINSKVSLNDITVGGTNLIPLGNIVTATSTQTSYDSTNDIRTITVANGAGGSWGGGLQNNAVTKHEIPWGQSYTYSVEIKPSVDGLIWNSDTNTYPYGVSAWGGNDNDNVSRRSSNSSMGGGTGTKLIPNVWNKVWVTIINSDSRNSNKVSLYDNSTICVVNTTGSTVTVLFRHFKGELGNVPTDYSPAPDDINSQIQQLSDNINLCVVKNDVINQINLSTEGILIAGKKVHISGQTTIDNAVIKSAMIDSISADKITAGTLNAANVNVINLNANNISSGTLTGVSFHQSSSGHDTWIDGNGVHDYDGAGNNAWIKQGILQVYDNANQGFIMDAGSIKLTSINNYQTNATDMYGSIQRNSNLFDASTYGMDIIGSNGLVMRTNNATGIKLSSSAMLGTSIVGSFIGLSNNGKAVIGLQKDIQIFAGSSYTSVGGLTVKPVFYLGTNAWQGEGVDDGSNAYLAGAGITLDAAGSITLNIGHNKRIYWGTNHQDSTDGHSFFTTNSSGYYFWGGDTSSYQSIHVQSVSQSSLLSLKTNLNKLDPAQALAILNDTDIYSYNYKSDLKNGISKTYATAVIDDVNTKPQYNTPYDFISADGTGRDDGTILGYAVAAIQELNSKIISLETEIKQLKGAA
jgi:hypothetical protein